MAAQGREGAKSSISQLQRVRSGGSMVLLALVFASCGPKRTSGAEAQFAIFKQDSYFKTTYLSELNSPSLLNGRIPVCIQSYGYDDPAEETLTREKVKASLQAAVNTWNAGLAADPIWSHKGGIVVDTTVSPSCVVDRRTLVIRLFDDQYDGPQSLLEVFCKKQDPERFSKPENFWLCRSNANPAERAMNLYTGYGDLDRLLLHEWGHMIGLSDSYNYRTNPSEPLPGQPASVMNGGSKTLTSDDISGLNTYWQALLSGRDPQICPHGYVIKNYADGQAAVDAGGRSDTLYCQIDRSLDRTCSYRFEGVSLLKRKTRIKGRHEGRTTLALPPDARNITASIPRVRGVGDQFRLFVNGAALLPFSDLRSPRASNPWQPVKIDISPHLRPGANSLRGVVAQKQSGRRMTTLRATVTLAYTTNASCP